MSKDRLSQIWGGFSQTTSLDLAGTGVEATPRPSRDRHDADLPHYADSQHPAAAAQTDASAGQAIDPVSAALSAMHTEMTSGQARRARRDAPAPVDHTAPPQSALEQTLLADLAFTQSKTTRRDADYLTYAADRQDAWQRRKRKKFLGLF